MMKTLSLHMQANNVINQGKNGACAVFDEENCCPWLFLLLWHCTSWSDKNVCPLYFGQGPHRQLKHIYTYSWKFYLLFGVKIFKIGFDLHISFFIWNLYGRLYIKYRIEIEKQPNTMYLMWNQHWILQY
jgi:hypothetical protein